MVDSPQHPAPHRHKISRLNLFLSLAGAPVAWIALMSGCYIASSYSCYPHQQPLAMPLWKRVDVLLDVWGVLCLLFGMAATAIAYFAWHRTKHEAGGGKKNALDVGEGRVRFLAMGGMLCSGIFIIGIIFSLIPILMVGICGR